MERSESIELDGLTERINFSDMRKNEIETLANSIASGGKLTDGDMRRILSCRDQRSIENIFAVARRIRDLYFSKKVFLYSFVYFSTYCKNECAFCYYNRKNKISRYRLTEEELYEAVKKAAEEGVHMIDLTMGEDPYFHDTPEKLNEYIRIAKDVSKLPVMVSPGVIRSELVSDLKKNGADFLALYQETHDREIFQRLRCGQNFDERSNIRKKAKECGMCVEDGILTGIGNDEEEEIRSVIASVKGMISQNPDQVRAMTFEPQPGTPLGDKKQASYLTELKTIALLRFVFPDRLIPASLDVAGIKGMVERLNAGANVVTSIISKDSALEGVVNFDRDVELSERRRDVKSVVSQLEKMDLYRAEQKDFENYIKERIIK